MGRLPERGWKPLLLPSGLSSGQLPAAWLRHKGSEMTSSGTATASTRSLRILVATPELPYPPHASGNRVILYNLLERLHGRHRFDLISYATEEEKANLGPLADWCGEITLLPIKLPDWFRRERPFADRLLRHAHYGEAMVSAVREALSRNRYDAAHVHTAALSPLGDMANGTPAILYAIDGSFLALRNKVCSAPLRLARHPVGFGRSVLRVANSLRCFGKFDRVIYVGETDARLDAPFFGRCKAGVIPNGVDTGFYKPANETPQGFRMVFTGVMDYGPNVNAVAWFAREVMPLVRERIPDAAFDIVGMCPSAEVRDLAHLPGVAVTGEVPDVRPYLWASRVFVCPLLSARGLQNKVLQAMSAGLPVVGSPSSFRGLNRIPPPGGIAAQTPDAFADALFRIHADPVKGREMGCQGRRFVEKRFSWEEACRKYEAHCLSIVHAKARQRFRGKQR